MHDNSRTPLVLTFHLFNFKVRDKIRKNFYILKDNPETSSIFSNNPLVSFRDSKISGKPKSIAAHPRNCRHSVAHSQCKNCKFIDSSPAFSAPTFVYHIKHHFICSFSNLIYCISCSRFRMLYIRKTGRTLKTRFGQHRRVVISNDANQPAVRHFNNGSICVSDIKIRALSRISGTNKASLYV